MNVTARASDMAPTWTEVKLYAFLVFLAVWVSLGVTLALHALKQGYYLHYVWAFIAAFAPTQLGTFLDWYDAQQR